MRFRFGLLALTTFLSVPAVHADMDGNFPGHGSYAKWRQAADLLNAGVDAYDANGLDKAERLLNQAAAIYPDDAALQYHLGKVALKKGRTKQAVSYFQRSVSMQPQTDNLGELAIALAQLRQFRQARAALGKAKELAKTPQQQQTLRQTTDYIQKLERGS